MEICFRINGRSYSKCPGENMFQDGLLRKSANKSDLSRYRKRVFNTINGTITSGKGSDAVIVAAIAPASAAISAATLYDTVMSCTTIIVYTPLLVSCARRLSKWKRVRQCK